MGLIGNGSLNGRVLARQIGGTIRASDTLLPPSAQKNRFTKFNATAATPNGYLAPVAWVLPKVAGGLGSNLQITGELSTTNAGLVSGYPVQANLTGQGLLTNASLGAIVGLLASLSGTGMITNANATSAAAIVANFSATGTITDAEIQVIASIFCVANLSGLGTLTDAQLGAIVDLTSSLSAVETVSANPFATFNLEADIASFTELSPQNLAEAVWSAQAADFNSAGTMGEKLNDAGAAGNPWAANLSDNNSPGTFGNFVQKLLTLGKFLGLK